MITDDRILEEYNNNIPITHLARKYKMARRTITKILKKNNIFIRPTGHYCNWSTIDSSFFKEIKDEASAYFLGLLYADGCITKCGFQISLSGEEDRYLIEKFKEYLKYTGNLINEDAYINKKGLNLKEKCRLSINSQKLREDLISNGCIPRKSLTLKFPTHILPKLMNHFIRGYFDGDGSVSALKNRIQFSIFSSKSFIKGLSKFLSSIEVITPVLLPKNNHGMSAYIHGGGPIMARRFYNFIYKDASIYMNRKKKIFDEYFENYIKELYNGKFARGLEKRKEMLDLMGVKINPYLMSLKSKVFQDEVISRSKKGENCYKIYSELGADSKVVKRILQNHEL